MSKIILFALFLGIVISSTAKNTNSPKPDTNTINNYFDTYLNLRQSNPTEALEQLQKAIIVAGQIKNQEKMAVLLYHKGYLYRMLGINNLALKCDLSSLAIYDKLGEQNVKGWLLVDIGLLYLFQEKDYKMSLMHFEKAMVTFTNLKNDIGIIVTNYDLGQAYNQLKKFNKAIFYYEAAIKFSKEAKEPKHEANSYSLLGRTYLNINNFKKAELNFNNSNKLYQKLYDKEGLAESNLNFASLALALNKKEESIQYYQTALDFQNKIKDKAGIAETYIKIASVYDLLGNKDKAIFYSEKALAIADSNQIINLQVEVLPILSNYFSLKNQLPKAFLYLRRFTDLKESNIVKNTHQMETEYEFQLRLQDKEIEDEIKTKHNLLTGFLIGGLLLFILVALIIYRKNLELKKSYQHLFKSNLELTKKDEVIADITKQTKYTRSPLKDEQNQSLIIELENLIENEKVFLKNDFTLDDLAKQLNSNRTYISQVINDKFNTNFSNYINEHRVKEAQKIFLKTDSKHFTIEAIAQDVGFNSKSSFNTAFKKFTGLTPSNFIEMNILANKGE